MTRHSWDAEVVEYKPEEGKIVIGMDKIMSISEEGSMPFIFWYGLKQKYLL